MRVLSNRLMPLRQICEVKRGLAAIYQAFPSSYKGWCESATDITTLVYLELLATITIRRLGSQAAIQGRREVTFVIVHEQRSWAPEKVDSISEIHATVAKTTSTIHQHRLHYPPHRLAFHRTNQPTTQPLKHTSHTYHPNPHKQPHDTEPYHYPSAPAYPHAPHTTHRTDPPPPSTPQAPDPAHPENPTSSPGHST